MPEIAYPFPIPALQYCSHVPTSSGAFLAFSLLPCPSIPESIPYLIRFENTLQPFHDYFPGNDTIRLFKSPARTVLSVPAGHYHAILYQLGANDFNDRRYMAFNLFPLRSFSHNPNECFRTRWPHQDTPVVS